MADLQRDIGEQQQKQDRVVRQTAKLQKEIRSKKGTLEATAEEVHTVFIYMYVCMYVRMYVCMYVHMYVRMYVCMYVCISVVVIAICSCS